MSLLREIRTYCLENNNIYNELEYTYEGGEGYAKEARC